MDKVLWPSWRYGPGGQARVFDSGEDVPVGWHDHPSKVVTPESTGTRPLPPVVDKLSGEQTGTKPLEPDNGVSPGGAPAGNSASDQSNTLDADGWPWDATLHAATKSKTQADLWRMKVGVSRPAPKPGFPKPVLDL